MAEILREYTNLLSADPEKAIDYIKDNTDAVNKIFVNAADELILNAKVRFLENYMHDFDNIKRKVLELPNSFTSQSAIVCNFLVKSKGKLSLEEEQELESMLVSNATRFSLMYFITQKADEISGLDIKEQLEPQYLEFIRGVTHKTLMNITSNERTQLVNFINMKMQRSDVSDKAFLVVQELL